MGANPIVIRNAADIQYNYTPGIDDRMGNTQTNIYDLNVYTVDVKTQKIGCVDATGPGEIIKFTLIAVNEGNTDLDAILFKEIFDPRMTFIQNSIKASINGISTFYALTTNPNFIISVSGPISPNDQVLVSLNASVTNTLNITSSPLVNSINKGYIYTDPTSVTHNQVTVTPNLYASSITIPVKYARIVIDKETQSVINHTPSGVTISNIMSGAELAYVIHIRNLGNLTAINVGGSDLIPYDLKIKTPEGIAIYPGGSYSLNNNYLTFWGITVPSGYMSGTSLIPGTAIINITGIVKA